MNLILEELSSLEPIFHYPEKFGRTRKAIEAQMCDEFKEIGASGQLYTKKDVIETLVMRYNDSNYQNIFQASNFKITKISTYNYLLNYDLIQNGVRYTKRSTIWRKTKEGWKILYHQGTIMKERL